MKKKILTLMLAAFALLTSAQEEATAQPSTQASTPAPTTAQKQLSGSELHRQADAESQQGHIATARYFYIRAYETLTRQGKTAEGVLCGTKATALYYKENYYQEGFDLLRRVDQSIEAAKDETAAAKAGMHYQTSRERFLMYMKMHRSAPAMEQLTAMERYARASGDEQTENNMLYNKTVYYYTFGQDAKANATFSEMAARLTAQKEYGKVDEVYRTLIANGRKSGNVNLVAQSYKRYMAWKDSVATLRHDDEMAVLKQQIAANEEAIAEKDGSLATRQGIIVGLSTLAAALAVALVLCAVVLLRFIAITRRQKKTIRQAKETNALKAQFISNIAAQLEPTLKRLDTGKAEVKALLDFTNHVQTLSALENDSSETPTMEDTPVTAFCEDIMKQVRGRERAGVLLRVDAPKMNAMIAREEVKHILLHLLDGAAQHTPEGGHITLEFKKRSAHKHQFIVSNTGSAIAEELREEIFKPFRELHDLTEGDGLGLPICRLMAQHMNGDLSIDPEFTKGVRFVLDLHV